MRIGHIGYSARMFCRIAPPRHLWPTTPRETQEGFDVLRSVKKNSFAATSDAFKVSRRTLYRWKKTLREAGGNPASLSPRASSSLFCVRY